MAAYDSKFLDELYNVFDPFEPLKPGDPQYVDCREVRGDGDILTDLGNKIRRSQRNLLFNRCLLEYRDFDEEGELQPWCDVHPLIKNLPEFKEALAALAQQ